MMKKRILEEWLSASNHGEIKSINLVVCIFDMSHEHIEEFMRVLLLIEEQVVSVFSQEINKS